MTDAEDAARDALAPVTDEALGVWCAALECGPLAPVHGLVPEGPRVNADAELALWCAAVDCGPLGLVHGLLP